MIPRGTIANSMYLGAVAVVLLVLVCGAATDATTRIVPIGDSITKGMINTDDGGNHPTYRYWLYNSLRSDGKNFDFVGSWSDPNFPFVSFDQHNEGHGGYTIGGILRGVKDDPSHLSDWLPRYSAPNIALILLGTNDVLAQVPLTDRFNNMKGIVDTLRARNPDIRIFIAKIPPTGDSYRNQHSLLYAFNDNLPGYASSWNTARSPVTVVDCFSGYSGTGHNQAPRYIHPNQAGEQLIASRFFNAIRNSVESGNTGTPVPTPTPTFSYAISGPRTIDRSGSYYFTKDIVNSNEAVFVRVQASDVTIDGRGYRLDGIDDGTQAGISVESGANRVTVKNLRLTDWPYGVYYAGASSGSVQGCTIEGSSWAGIVLYAGSNSNTVTGNRVTGTHYGIYVGESTNNRIYNNRFSAPEGANAGANIPGTTWSVPKQAGPNIVGGPSIGGNFWATPSGTGYSETGTDANGDGFVDTPYKPFDALAQYDQLPLARPGAYRALSVPGTIEAEDYDYGGEGVAYHDTVAGNQGGAYRSDDVDIEAIPGGYAVAYIRDGEWTQYTATVQQAGTYTLELRAAAWNGPRTVRVLLGSTEIGTVTVPQTASSSTFTTAATAVTLPAGRQALRLAFTGDGLNLDRAVLAAAGTPSPTPTANVTPTPTPTADVTPTPTVTVTPTANATETVTPTPTPTVNATPTANVTVTPTPTLETVAPVPPSTAPPTDTDGDRLFDDVNGNGRADFADIVLYFTAMEWIAAHEPIAAFDCNGNGRIDFADVVWLFNRL